MPTAIATFKRPRATRLRRVKLFASALLAALLLEGLFAYPATQGFFAYPTAQKEPLSAPLREYLDKEIGLTGPEMETVIGARPVTKRLKTETGSEVALFGIVRIYAPQELFIRKIRDIAAFERGKGVYAVGLLHSPPLLRDVAALQLDNSEVEEIPKCKPGDCSIKLSDQAMRYLREHIDWSSPKANGQAQAVIRRAFVDYVTSYQKIGDEALATYNDRDKPQVIRDSLHQLLQNSSSFIQYDPQLASYLEKYPQERPPDTEDIFYWQKAEFGLKPVVRASHLVIHRMRHEKTDIYAIASKMLYASHYFRAALELKWVVPDSESGASESFYLVCLNRSFVDGLAGLQGALIRGKVVERSRQSLAGYLANVKERIEAANRER